MERQIIFCCKEVKIMDRFVTCAHKKTMNKNNTNFTEGSNDEKKPPAKNPMRILI